MSNITGEQDRYFHCPKFEITMQTVECQRRRDAAAGRKRRDRDVGSEHAIANRYMTKVCGKCELYREALSKSISKEEMLQALEANPSQEPSKFQKVRTSNPTFGTLHTPHIGRIPWR